MWSPTTEQILGLDGVSHRVDRFRFELCDQRYRPIGELHPDRTGSVPSIEVDTSATTSRRLSGLRLLPDEAGDVDPITDRLRVWMVLQNGAEFLLGTFLWADASRPDRSWGVELHSDLVDLGFVLDQPATEAFGWGRGAQIGLIVLFLFMRAGFELDDISPLSESASTKTLVEPIAFNPGTTWATMLEDLTMLLGWGRPWFDRFGQLRLGRIPDPEIAQPTVPAYDVGTRVIADSILRSDDILAAPNDFAVTDSGTEQMIIGRYQLPASAPHSFQRRGFRVGLVESGQGIVSKQQADIAATWLAVAKGSAYRWVSFSTTADPRHDMWDVIDVFGVRSLETKWGMQLRSGGEMTHTVRQTGFEVR